MTPESIAVILGFVLCGIVIIRLLAVHGRALDEIELLGQEIRAMKGRHCHDITGTGR